MEIGIGIIGWGFMGKTHTHALRALPLFYPDAGFTVKLVGVCSHTLTKAQKAQKELGFEYATDDYRVLLQDERIQVVSICTPNGLHEQMAVDALNAGKNVYLDKPMTVTEDEARHVCEAAERAKGKLQLALNNRFFPATMRARELVNEGKIGKLLTCSCRYLHSGSIDADKPMGWKMGRDGGVLLDLASHALDLLTMLTGMPDRIICENQVLYPERKTKDGGICTEIKEDQALMMLHFPGGALGTVEASKISTGAADEMELEVRGTKGAVRWNLKDPGWLEFFDQTEPEKNLGGMRGFTRIECLGKYPAPGGAFLPSKNCVGWDRGHMHCYYSFLHSIAEGREPVPNAQDGLRLQHLLEKAKESAEKHCWIEI